MNIRIYIYMYRSCQSNLNYDTIRCFTLRLYNYFNYQCGLLLEFKVYSLWINISPRGWARYSDKEPKPRIRVGFAKQPKIERLPFPWIRLKQSW